MWQARSVLTALFVILLTNMSIAQSNSDPYQRGPLSPLQAPMAPEWDISVWVKGPELKLSELRGQVVVIDFFQLWCPGCNSFSIPLMAKWEKEFAKEIKEKKLTLVSIHTVFEGRSYQTNKRLRKFIKEKNFNHPVGVDRYSPANRLPNTMVAYDTRGTPEIAIIDKNGRIRFQKFGSFDPDWATKYIRLLLSERNNTTG